MSLQAGKHTWLIILSSGPLILGLAVIVCLLALLLTYRFGRYILRYDSGLVFASALAGSRRADPTLAMLLQVTQNNIPTLRYAISSSIAQITVMLLGPIIVASS